MTLPVVLQSGLSALTCGVSSTMTTPLLSMIGLAAEGRGVDGVELAVEEVRRPCRDRPAISAGRHRVIEEDRHLIPDYLGGRRCSGRSRCNRWWRKPRRCAGRRAGFDGTDLATPRSNWATILLFRQRPLPRPELRVERAARPAPCPDRALSGRLDRGCRARGTPLELEVSEARRASVSWPSVASAA